MFCFLLYKSRSQNKVEIKILYILIHSIKRPLTYDEWLSKQLEAERKIAEEKKMLEEEDTRKKLDEEDK